MYMQPWRGRTKSPVRNTEEWAETPLQTEKFLASQKFKQDAKTAATLEKQESDGEVFVTSQELITVETGLLILVPHVIIMALLKEQ